MISGSDEDMPGLPVAQQLRHDAFGLGPYARAWLDRNLFLILIALEVKRAALAQVQRARED